jgi:hypothetical protein
MDSRYLKSNNTENEVGARARWAGFCALLQERPLLPMGSVS